MTMKCYDKPNRKKPRVFTAKDCGRIVCYAIADGANPQDVREAISECLPQQCKYDEILDQLTTLLEYAAILTSLIPVFGVISKVARFIFASPFNKLLGMPSNATGAMERVVFASEGIEAELKVLIENVRNFTK